jgi:hypothetical protein
MLYFPAGMWHKVETIEPGVSINVSLMATNYAALACQAIHHYLLTKDEWRETVVSGPTSTSTNALEHMQTLLRELPALIANMTKMNFAEQMLPPVVRHPPALELVSDQDNNVENDDEEVSNDDDELVQDEMADNEADDKEAAVDVNSFVVPENWSPNLDGNGQLIVNVLASLVRMRDVTSFYIGDDNEGKDTSSLYVLNINYGGNDMHESVVRVVLEDLQGNLEPLVDGQPVGMVSCEFEATEDLACWQKCLLYYGFFVWQQNVSHA